MERSIVSSMYNLSDNRYRMRQERLLYEEEK